MTRRRPFTPGLPRGIRDLALWCVATYGVLKLAALPGDGGAKVLCGPWGCLPPLQALAAAHGFWLMLIVPALIWARDRLSARGLRRLGGSIAAIGGVGIAVTAARSAMTWRPQIPGTLWWHPILGAAFEVAMLVDVPLVELVVAGMVCTALARRREKAAVAGRPAAAGAGEVPGQDHSPGD